MNAVVLLPQNASNLMECTQQRLKHSSFSSNLKTCAHCKHRHCHRKWLTVSKVVICMHAACWNSRAYPEEGAIAPSVSIICSQSLENWGHFQVEETGPRLLFPKSPKMKSWMRPCWNWLYNSNLQLWPTKKIEFCQCVCERAACVTLGCN